MPYTIKTPPEVPNVVLQVEPVPNPTPPMPWWKSRRLIVALVAILVSVVVHFLPQLQEVQDSLINLIAAVALTAIAGYSIEDAIKASKRGAGGEVDQIMPLVESVLNTIFLLFAQLPQQTPATPPVAPPAAPVETNVTVNTNPESTVDPERPTSQVAQG